MKFFLCNVLKFTVFPVFFSGILIILYLNKDPYLDFGVYTDYSWKYRFQQMGDLATKKLLTKTKASYNSFIMGSSRTTGIYGCYLEKKITNSKFFHYVNFNESIGGIYSKLYLLDSLGYRLDNIIIYLDTDTTFKNYGEVNFADHYLLTKKTKFKSQLEHFKLFMILNSDKINILLGNELKGESFPNWTSDLKTNDPNHICSDSIILSYKNHDKLKDKEYLKSIDSLKKTGFMFKRDKMQKYEGNQISKIEFVLLTKIKGLFDKHKSNYYIIITPLYDQLKFSKSDIEKLNNVFKNKLYDFSGINKITDNEFNYPDRSHFLPYISKQIMDSILKKNE
jgi:hypothetical protein